MRRPETLEELYSPGTTLREVDPNFRGMALKLWEKLKAAEQCNAYLKTLDRSEAPLSRQAIATPRDSYGKKSLPGSAPKRKPAAPKARKPKPEQVSQQTELIVPLLQGGN